jgi:hypothetical protein
MADTRGVIRAERMAVWLIAVLAVAGLGALAVGPGADFRTETPTVEPNFSYDSGTSAVTVAHTGGDSITGTNAVVTVLVTDSDRNATSRFRWQDGPDGSSFVVDDPSVDSDGDGNVLDGDGSVGFTFAPGDTIEVVWRGRLLGAPETQTTQLGKFIIPGTA